MTVCPVVLFVLAIVLSVLLRFTASDFPLVSSNSSFVTYHRVCNKSKTTCATSGTGTANPFGSHQVFSGIRVARSIFNFLCGVLKDHCLPFCPFFLGLCSICPSSTYVFRLPHWYLLTFLKKLSFIDYSWYI